MCCQTHSCSLFCKKDISCAKETSFVQKRQAINRASDSRFLPHWFQRNIHMYTYLHCSYAVRYSMDLLNATRVSYAYIHVYVFVHIYTHMYVHVYIYTCRSLLRGSFEWSHRHSSLIYIYIYTCMYILVCIHIYVIYTCIYTCIIVIPSLTQYPRLFWMGTAALYRVCSTGLR